jgi:hypothetical protein
MDGERLESIRTLRILIFGYLADNIDFTRFYEEASLQLGSSFDPFNSSTADLDSELIEELKLYSKFTGGEFGEYEEFLPKNEGWRYGESVEKFGWIDTAKYKELLEKEFLKLNLKDI